MITTTRPVVPHFTGAHLGFAPEGDRSKVTFRYRSPITQRSGAYHTSGEDAVNLLVANSRYDQEYRPEGGYVDILERSVYRTGGPADLAREQFLAELVQKAHNEPLKKAIKHQEVSNTLSLLTDPDIKLSDYDTPGSDNVVDRVLANDENFNYFTHILGGVKHAKSFIEKLLARQIEPELAQGFNSGNWREQPVEERNHLMPKKFTKKRDDKDIKNSALALAKETVKEYRG